MKIGLVNGSLINEVYEVQEYLEGKNINKRFGYRICYMLAAYYRDKGLAHAEIRQKITEFCDKYGCFFDFSINSVIYRVFEDGVPLRGDVPVYINERDIQEIRQRFDSKNARMLALALLAYGKVCANDVGECSISMLALSNWLNMDYTNMLNRYFRELVDFGYVSKVEFKHNWNKNHRYKMMRIRFNVPLVNEGPDRIRDNNVVPVFNKYF